MQKLTLKLNDRMSISIEGDKAQDLIRNAAFWQSIPDKCGICAASLVFDYQTPQTYKYYKLKCTGPTPHTVNLSERSDHSGMYFDARKPWETWRIGADDAGNNAAAAGVAGPPAQATQPPEHPNSPNGERGKLIATVKRNYDDCRDRNIPGFDKVKLQILNRFTDEQLANAAAYLKNLLDNPKPKPAGDDDIPF
jgi:hypothetical protein